MENEQNASYRDLQKLAKDLGYKGRLNARKVDLKNYITQELNRQEQNQEEQEHRTG